MNIKRSLKIALAKQDMTQKALADSLGYTRQRLNGIQKQKNIRPETLKSIADIFGLKVSEFIALGED